MSVSLSWSTYARLPKERRVRLDEDEWVTVRALGAVILASPTSRWPAVSKLFDPESRAVKYAALLRDEVVLCPTLEEACKRYTDVTRHWVHGEWAVTETWYKAPWWGERALELEARRIFGDKRYAIKSTFSEHDNVLSDMESVREYFIARAEHEFAKTVGMC